MEAPDREFVSQLTDWQSRLFAYLVTLLGGSTHDARDVLQETNLVLWRKIQEFEPGTDFGAWARRVAYYEALAFIRDRKRDRHVFDDDLVALFGEEWTPHLSDGEERLISLRHCLTGLSEEERLLIDRRYRGREAVRKLAEDYRRKESAMKMKLMRIRESLHTCIQNQLKEQEA